MSSENENDKPLKPEEAIPPETPINGVTEGTSEEAPVNKPIPKKAAKKVAPIASDEVTAPIVVEGAAPTETSSVENVSPVEVSNGEVKPIPKKIPPKAASAAGVEGEAAPVVKKEAPPPPPPPEHGVYGKLLQACGLNPEAFAKAANGMETIGVSPAELLATCQMLRDDPGSQFDLLVSIAGVDWPTRTEPGRLEAVYHLYSTKTFKSVALKAIAVGEKLPSVVSVWIAADWHERETYDLFGIIFEGHPNLQRILMPSDWLGYPMRKDYKVEDPRLVWNER